MKKYLLSLLIIAFSGVATGQYCIPSYTATGIAAGALSIVQLNGVAGVNINDTLPVISLASGNINRSSTVSRLALQQGRSYTGTLHYYNRSAHTGNQVWIDFNNDNIFDDSFLSHNILIVCNVLYSLIFHRLTFFRLFSFVCQLYLYNPCLGNRTFLTIVCDSL